MESDDASVPDWERLGMRRQQFIRAMRVHNKEHEAELLHLVQAADVADLEWLLERIDDQIRNIPLHVANPADRDMLLKTAHHRRAWIGSALANKRAIAQRHEREKSNWLNAAIVLGVLIAAVALIVAVVALY